MCCTTPLLLQNEILFLKCLHLQLNKIRENSALLNVVENFCNSWKYKIISLEALHSRRWFLFITLITFFGIFDSYSLNISHTNERIFPNVSSCLSKLLSKWIHSSGTRSIISPLASNSRKNFPLWLPPHCPEKVLRFENCFVNMLVLLFFEREKVNLPLQSCLIQNFYSCRYGIHHDLKVWWSCQLQR